MKFFSTKKAWMQARNTLFFYQKAHCLFTNIRDVSGTLEITLEYTGA